MHIAEHRMTPGQFAALIDAALRMPHPLSFLHAAVTTFRAIGRQADATEAAWIACLYASDEMEAVLALRAAWRRGEDRSAAKVGKDVARCRS